MAKGDSIETGPGFPICVHVYQWVKCWDGSAEFSKVISLPFLPFKGLTLSFRNHDRANDEEHYWIPEEEVIDEVVWSVEHETLWVDLKHSNHTDFKDYGEHKYNLDPSINEVIAGFVKYGWEVYHEHKGVTKQVEKSLNKAGFFKVGQPNGRELTTKKKTKRKAIP